MNIESEANKDLALESEDAENVVGGTRKKKVTAKHHVVTKGGNHMIVEQPLGGTRERGHRGSCPGRPGYGVLRSHARTRARSSVDGATRSRTSGSRDIDARV